MRGIALATLLLAAACASPPPAAPLAGPVHTRSFAADAVTRPYQAREAAFQAGAAQCQAMGKRFVLVEDQSDWSRGAAAMTGLIRYRCV